MLHRDPLAALINPLIDIHSLHGKQEQGLRIHGNDGDFESSSQQRSRSSSSSSRSNSTYTGDYHYPDHAQPTAVGRVFYQPAEIRLGCARHL